MPERMSQLTEQEQKVLKLILAEYSNREIANIIHRSTRTVEGIKYRIMDKLEVTTVVGLVKYAIENGWLDSKQLIVPEPSRRLDKVNKCLQELHKALTEYLQS